MVTITEWVTSNAFFGRTARHSSLPYQHESVASEIEDKRSVSDLELMSHLRSMRLLDHQSRSLWLHIQVLIARVQRHP